MRYSLVLLLCLVACNMGSIAMPSSGTVVLLDSDPPQGEPKNPADSQSAVVSDSGSDAGIDSSLPEATDSGAEASIDASTLNCRADTSVVGHCLYNMATACQESFSDDEAWCKDLDVHPMGGTWWTGTCGCESGTDLTYSNGGCKDEFGSIHWDYLLNKVANPPTSKTRQASKEMCDAWGNRTYIPVP